MIASVNSLVEWFRTSPWLMDLNGAHLDGDARLLLHWAHPPPAWIVFGFAVATLAVVIWIYGRLPVSRTRRVLLATIRLGMLALVAVVICQPMLVLQRSRIEPSYVVLAIDRSQSMGFVDPQDQPGTRPQPGAPAQPRGTVPTKRQTRLEPMSRLELAKAALLRAEGASLRQLLSRNAVELITFAGDVESNGFFAKSSGSAATRNSPATHPSATHLIQAIEKIKASGTSTDLVGAVKHIMDDARGRRLAAVILISDGQMTRTGNLNDVLDMAGAGPLPSAGRIRGLIRDSNRTVEDPSRDRKGAGTFLPVRHRTQTGPLPYGRGSVLLERLNANPFPIFPLRIGSTQRPQDIELDEARVEPNVFVGDLVAVHARVSASALTTPTTVTVRLLSQPDGKVLDSKQMLLQRAGDFSPRGPKPAARYRRRIGVNGESSATVELHFKPTVAGPVSGRVEVLPLPGESTLQNNAQQVDMTVLDAAIRVLYVDGYPRYEYRYLKNALVREPLIDLSVLLLEADNAFVQEGTFPIRRFPRTLKELNRFDVVLFGDVDPQPIKIGKTVNPLPPGGGWLSLEQMNLLVEFVGDGGGGFGLIAGERSAPRRFKGTPLEKLIAIRIDPTGGLTATNRGASPSSPLALVSSSDRLAGSGPVAGSDSSTKNPTNESAKEAGLPMGLQPSMGFHIKLTPEGLASRIFRPTSTVSPAGAAREQTAQPVSSVFETLPELFWFARTLGPMPGASVLAIATPLIQTMNGPMPIVVTGRYGAGKLFFQATDDTWRWRRHAGEFLHDTYWVQVVRSLMRDRLASDDRRLIIRTDRRVYPYGVAVQTEVEVVDTRLLAQWGRDKSLGGSIPMEVVEVERLTTTDDTSDTSGKGKLAMRMGRFNVHRVGTESNRFTGTWMPPQAGSYIVRVADKAVTPSPGLVPTQPRVSNKSTSNLPTGSNGVRIRVQPPDLENRRPEANHAVLEQIAATTGGRVIELDEIESALHDIPDRSVLIPDDIVKPLWDSKLVLLLLALMISMEWVLRKAFGLL